MKQYDFTNKAIKCETWEQMLNLAREARHQGIRSHMFNSSDFNNGMNIFLIDSHLYMNYTEEIANRFSYTIVTYSDFITPHTPEHWYTSVQQHEH